MGAVTLVMPLWHPPPLSTPEGIALRAGAVPAASLSGLEVSPSFIAGVGVQDPEALLVDKKTEAQTSLLPATRGSSHMLSRFAQPKVRCIPLTWSRGGEEGRRPRSASALPCGPPKFSARRPLARPSLLIPTSPETSPPSPPGIHPLPFPLPNYAVGEAGIQPGPQIPALGGAQEYRFLSVSEIPF